VISRNLWHNKRLQNFAAFFTPKCVTHPLNPPPVRGTLLKVKTFGLYDLVLSRRSFFCDAPHLTTSDKKLGCGELWEFREYKKFKEFSEFATSSFP